MILFFVVVGTALAAILGGVIWGFLVILTGYKLGFAAWAVGGLSGVAAVLFSKGKRGRPFQVIAACSSVIGVTIGKYISFYNSVAHLFKAEYGAEGAKDVSIFSLDLMRVFAETIDTTLSGRDMLWVILALVTAWIIPRSTRHQK